MVNPKLVLSDFFDSLISQIDIHTEEQLEKYQENDTLSESLTFVMKSNINKNDEFKIGPFDDPTIYGIEFHLDPYSEYYEYDKSFLNEPPRSTNILNYLNDARETMLGHVQKSRADAHERYQMSMKDEFKKFENDEIDELKRHLFTQQFLFLIRVDEIILGTNSSQLPNPSPYRLYLLVTDYFIDRHEQFLFGSFIDEKISGFMFFGDKQENISQKDDEAIIKTHFDLRTLRAHMLKQYFLEMLIQRPNEHVLCIKQADLFSVEKVSHIECGFHFDLINIDEKFSHELAHIRSLDIVNYKRRRMPRRIRSRLKFQLNSLAGLKNLTCLRLEKIQLVDSSLQCLTNLRRLELVECDFKSFRSDSFRNVPNIQVLIIETPQNYSHLNLSNFKASNLAWLQINNATLSNFSISSVRILNISNSIYESNASDFLQQLQPSRAAHLESLDLSHNEISNFDGAWLVGLVGLKRLRLAFCSIKTINLSYEYFERLESLDLSHNQLESLENVFDELKNLKYLDLSGNESSLVSLNEKTFAKLRNLERFDLQDVHVDFSCPNQIDLFQPFSKLAILNLSNTNLLEIDPSIFTPTLVLQQLDLSHNNLRLEQDTFFNLKNLRFLDLNSNNLRQIRNGVFRHLKQLDTLNISYNRLRSLSSQTFEGLESLRKLSIRNNELENVGPDTFSFMESLEEVQLDKNLERICFEHRNSSQSEILFLFF